MQLSSELPGICDFHVHVGETIGGYTLADSFRTLSVLAQKVGISAIGAFVTEDAKSSLYDKFHRMQDDADRHFVGHVHWHLTPTTATVQDTISLLGKSIDLKFYTTYKPAGIYRSYVDIEHWMQDLSDVKPRMLIHCEDNETIEKFSARHHFHSPADHCLRRPEIAENIAVERVLELAVKHQYPVHIVHVSSATSALLIHEAKTACERITCETAPHYLIYNEAHLTENKAHRYLCSPPYRSEQTRGMMVELLQDGYFDIIASDHCPFTLADKDRYADTPEQVPCGIAGVGTLFKSMYEHFVKTGKITLDELIALTVYNPAKLMNYSPKPLFTIGQMLG